MVYVNYLLVFGIAVIVEVTNYLVLSCIPSFQPYTFKGLFSNFNNASD